MTPLRRKDVVAVAFAAAICAVFYFAPDDAKSDAKATLAPTINTPFQELSATYAANAVAFNAKYKGKLFLLHGKVVSVSESLAGPSVTVDEDALSQYTAIFKNDNDVVSLEPDDRITFTCDSFDLGIQMDGCSINR